MNKAALPKIRKFSIAFLFVALIYNLFGIYLFFSNFLVFPPTAGDLKYAAGFLYMPLAHVRFDEGNVETELRPDYLGTARRKGRKQTNQTYCYRATSLLYRGLANRTFNRRFRGQKDAWCVISDMTGLNQIVATDMASSASIAFFFLWLGMHRNPRKAGVDWIPIARWTSVADALGGVPVTSPRASG